MEITSEDCVLLLFEQISVLFTYAADAKLRVEKHMLVPESKALYNPDKGALLGRVVRQFPLRF